MSRMPARRFSLQFGALPDFKRHVSYAFSNRRLTSSSSLAVSSQ